MTRSEFMRKLTTLNNTARLLNERTNNFLEELKEMGVDIHAPSEAENADDIETAIQCYIMYNEYTQEALWEEVKQNRIMRTS